MLLLLTCSINLLALLVALKPLLLALRLLNGVASGVWPIWLHRQHYRIRVSVSQCLFAQCALPKWLVSGLALPARAVLLLAREFTLLALLLGARTLFGFKRAPVWRCTLLRQGGRNNLHGLARPGLLAQAFNRPAGAGIALQVVLAWVVRALITSVIAPVAASVLALARSRWLQLTGYDGPHGHGSGRQCGRAGNPGQVAQASQAR